MKRIYGLLLLVLVLAPASAMAQSRIRRIPAAPATAAPAKSGPITKRDGANRITIQVNNLARFLYLFGGVAKVIEENDANARTGSASPELTRQNNASKVILRNSIHNFVDGLDQLELDFRSSPVLQKYYPTIKGTAARLAAAEDQAGAGQLKAASQTLLAAMDQLTQVLVAMTS
ncbi:MAG: hypothetical protein ABIP75_15040 [Pyrinomonadaceae bacterium]